MEQRLSGSRGCEHRRYPAGQLPWRCVGLKGRAVCAELEQFSCRSPCLSAGNREIISKHMNILVRNKPCFHPKMFSQLSRWSVHLGSPWCVSRWGHVIDVVVSSPHQAPVYLSPDGSARSRLRSGWEPGPCFGVYVAALCCPQRCCKAA